MLLDAIYEAYTDNGGTITRRNEASGTSETTTETTQETSADETASAGVSTTAAPDDAASADDSGSTDDTTNPASTGMVIGDSAETDLGGTTQTATMRILMLGNSFTYYNDMPAMLANLTDAEVVTHARGGAILAEQLSSDDQMGALTLAALEEGGWDYVVLQEKSSRPIRSNAEDYLKSVTKLAKLARECGATPIIFATWPYNEDAKRLANMGISREEMDEQLRAAFDAAATSSGALVADVEDAFAQASSHELLYAKDGVHPSVIGSKLAAEVIAQTIHDDQESRAA
jgi:lysophospholipase L1-like esterase